MCLSKEGGGGLKLIFRHPVCLISMFIFSSLTVLEYLSIPDQSRCLVYSSKIKSLNQIYCSELNDLLFKPNSCSHTCCVKTAFALLALFHSTIGLFEHPLTYWMSLDYIVINAIFLMESALYSFWSSFFLRMFHKNS